jgi:hypothetical protein
MEALWPAEVLEAVLAEVAESEPVQRLWEQIARRLREENLCAMRRRGDSRGPVHVEADITVGCWGRLAGVQPHTHADARVLGPFVRSERSLCGSGSCGGRAGARERDKECVSLGAELDAAVRREGLAQNAVVLGQKAWPAIAKPLGERRRAFDVRKEQRDGTRRQLHFGQRLPPAAAPIT